MTDRSSGGEQIAADFPTLDAEDEDQLLPQLVSHLREHRTRLRQEWELRIQDAHLLQQRASFAYREMQQAQRDAEFAFFIAKAC